jgi:alkylation response protein AidB-like acyl-CoA dehydrogenase
MAVIFSDEQLLLKELAQDFFRKEVKPVAAEIDARPNPKDCYPGKLINKASQLGLRTIGIPEEYGGGGVDIVTKSLLLDAMTEIEPGTAKCLSQCWKVCQVITEGGTEEQKKKFLTQFVEDHDCTGSVLLTEPNAGSDTLLDPPSDDLKSGVSMKAEEDGDCYVLNGTKHMSSLVGFSKVLIVYTRTDRSVPALNGTTTFIVPADLPGITFGQVHDKMGYRLYPNGESFWDNVRVPKEYILGEVNAGLSSRSKFGASVEIASMTLGICRAIYKLALEHAKQRVQGGKPIIGHQTVGTMLAEMSMLVDNLETYLYETAFQIRDNPKFDRSRVTYVNITSRESFMRIMMLALDVMGGVGIMRDHPMEKFLRDGITWLHASGTNSLNKLRVAANLRK